MTADLAPLAWSPWLTDPERFTASRGDDRFSVASDDGTWTWTAERILCARGESVVARACGEAASAEDAKRAAANHRWEVFILLYDHPSGGDTTWISGETWLPDPAQRTWTACLDGDRAQVHLSGVRRELDRPWYWSRQCAAAAELLALCGDRLHGYAETRELAMAAAIDAPDRLQRAAAAYLAQWKAARELV